MMTRAPSSSSPRSSTTSSNAGCGSVIPPASLSRATRGGQHPAPRPAAAAGSARRADRSQRQAQIRPGRYLTTLAGSPVPRSVEHRGLPCRSGGQLNVTEARHRIARKIFFGQRGELRQHYREGMEHQLGALGLALNAVVLFNTLYIDAAVKQLAADGFPVTDDLVARLSPLQYDHINCPRLLPHPLPQPARTPPRSPRPERRRGPAAGVDARWTTRPAPRPANPPIPCRPGRMDGPTCWAVVRPAAATAPGSARPWRTAHLPPRPARTRPSATSRSAAWTASPTRPRRPGCAAGSTPRPAPPPNVAPPPATPPAPHHDRDQRNRRRGPDRRAPVRAGLPRRQARLDPHRRSADLTRSESLHAIRGSAPPGVRVDGVQGLADAGEGTAQAVLGTAELLAGVPGDHRQVAAELAGGVDPLRGAAKISRKGVTPWSEGCWLGER